MPNDYYFGYYFFAPGGRFDACGMFTIPHILSALICVILITVALAVFKKKCNLKSQAMLRIFAVILTALETIKILHSFIYGDLHLDAWFPLSYCGLLIFALWMAGFGKGFIKDTGYVFIAFGCPIAGLAFLISPSTSLMLFPIWHYFSLYSMFYHSLMIFLGISLLFEIKKLVLTDYLKYCSFTTVFSIIAIIINEVFGSNLMLLRCPFNIPVQGLVDMYNYHPYCYTVTVFIGYLIIPILTAFITGKHFSNKKI